MLSIISILFCMTRNDLLPKIIWKRCDILKIMECDFKSELEDELGKLLFLYDFCYFNNAVTEEELREIGRLIRTHREVIKVLGGEND